MTITRRGKALAGASLYLSSSSLPFRRLLLRSFVPFSSGELARHLFRESLTLSSKRTMFNREAAIDASYDEREWRKVKFAIEVTKNQMKREPRRSAKFRSKKSMKCKSFPLQLRSPRRIPIGPAAFSFFPFSSTIPSIRSYLDRTFSAVSRTHEIRRKGGPGWRVPGRKGDFRVFRRTTDNLFVARTRPLEERSSSQHPSSPFFPPLFLFEQLRT